MDVVSQVAGVLIILATMLDVFLTVLLGGTISVISTPMNQWVWRLFRRLASALPDRRGAILPFAGPTIVFLTVVMWVSLLAIGFALVYMPALGDQIVSTDDETSTGFWAAVYFSTMALSTLGAGDVVATTTPYRLLETFEAIVGFSMLTASLTYVLSIYSALISYNSFALALHYASDETGNATNILVRLGPGGDFSSATTTLTAKAASLSATFEAHQNYVVLRYFRPGQVAYGMPRTLHMVMDLTSMLTTLIDQEQYRSTVRAPCVAQLQGLGMRMLRSLVRTSAQQEEEAGVEIDPATVESWRSHFRAAADAAVAEGIALAGDLDVAEERYIELRCEWHPCVCALTEFLMHERGDVIGVDSRERAMSDPAPMP